MDAVVPIGFDYSTLDETSRVAARAAAERIRTRMKATVQGIIEIGRDLVAIKQALPHGRFLPWIENEFAMSDQTARRFIQVAEVYGKSNTMLNLPPTALYELAAPSTPTEVRERVESRVQAGEKVTVEDIKALKEQWAEERKELKRQIEDAKFKVRDAKSIRNDVQQQLTDLQQQLTALRDERDTLRHELDHARTLAPAVRPMPQPEFGREPETPLPQLDTIDQQIAILEADWARVSERARQEFLRRKSAPAERSVA